LLSVFDKLGIKMTEIEDWNCCGATSYNSMDEMKAFGLSARNLALAEK
jgi:heterodisulfide reductase subunit B